MNNVVLTGRLTRDPEVRYSQVSQIPMARFTIAVDRAHKKGEQEESDFISCIAWDKTADFVGKYVKKGQKIALTGRIQTGSYTDRDGKKVYTTDVVAERVEFAGPKPEVKPQDNMSKYDDLQRAEYQQQEFMSVDLDDESLPFN